MKFCWLKIQEYKAKCLVPWLKKIIWVLEFWKGLLFVTYISTTCVEAIFRVKSHFLKMCCVKVYLRYCCFNTKSTPSNKSRGKTSTNFETWWCYSGKKHMPVFASLWMPVTGLKGKNHRSEICEKMKLMWSSCNRATCTTICSTQCLVIMVMLHGPRPYMGYPKSTSP